MTAATVTPLPSSRPTEVAVATPLLGRADIEAFHREGWLGPVTLMSPGEMAAIRARIDNDVMPTTGPNPANAGHCRHLDRLAVHALVTHPAIVGRAVSLLGPDVACWSSNAWIKEPGGHEIPWHQDFRYWPLEPALNVTAWIAIEPADRANGCVNLIPGSHGAPVPEVPHEGAGFATMADPAGVDRGRAVAMELEAGQCFLFNERLLHQSDPNRSTRRRFGWTVRLTTPWVLLPQDGRAPLYAGHESLLLSGRDVLGLNRIRTAAPTV